MNIPADETQLTSSSGESTDIKFTYEDIFILLLNNRLKAVAEIKSTSGGGQLALAKHVRREMDRSTFNVLLCFPQAISSQLFYDLLEFSGKEQFILRKGEQCLSLVKLMEFYVDSVDAAFVIDCSELLLQINELFVSSAGTVRNLINIYSMIVGKVLGLTIAEEEENKLGLGVFISLLNTISRVIAEGALKTDGEKSVALRACCNLFGHLCYKKSYESIRTTGLSYFTCLFTLLKQAHRLTRSTLNELLAALANQLKAVLDDPQHLTKNIVKVTNSRRGRGGVPIIDHAFFSDTHRRTTSSAIAGEAHRIRAP